MDDKMKKYLIIICCLILLTGCEKNKEIITANKETKINIINNYGEKEEISAKDLCNINNNDSNEYNEKYLGAKISFIGHINRIESGFTINNEDTIYDEITIKEGWIITIEDNDSIKDLKLEDSLNIEGNIGTAENCYIANNVIIENAKI